MSFNFQITQGLTKEALKIGLYAPEGYGKSTFCSQAPNSLTIDTENGTGRIKDCRRVVVTNWQMTIDVIKAVIDNPTICKTLVIDTMDKLETYGIDYLCEKNHKSSIEDWAYGKGYIALMELFQDFYKLLDKVHDLGIHIMLVAHAKPRKFELPDQEGAYDRWELKLNKQTAPLMKEWVDALFFGNYKTYVVTTETKSKKAQGNKRVLYCNHQPTFDAKNRFNLPDEIPFEFASISHLFDQGDDSTTVQETATLKPKESENVAKLRKLMEESDIKPDELEKVVVDRKQCKEGTHYTDYSDELITRWVFPNWQRILETIKSSKESK